MLLSKCCCCCSLKYGYFAYAILSMAFRLMACVSLFHASHIFFVPYSSASRYGEITHIFVSHGMSIYGGWVITTVVSLFFTMKGIVQKRSILIYPHIVVLVVELTGLVLSVILLIVVTGSTYFLIVLPFAAVILGYELWSLISLYKQIKYNERMRCTADTEPLKLI